MSRESRETCLFSVPAARGETAGEKLPEHVTGAGRSKMMPKPLGVMTYAEMSAEIASLFFKSTVLAAETKRLAAENAALKRRNGSAELALKQNREYYEREVVRLNTELSRVRRFADSIVRTI